MVVLPFGERVLHRQIREKDKKDKFESEDLEGVWLGHNRGSNEVLMGTHHAVVRAFSFRRRDERSRWRPILAKGMQGLPKQPDPTRPGSSVANSEFRVWTMAIVQSQWWYQYLSKKSTRGGSRSSRPQHVDGLRVHPRMYRVQTETSRICDNPGPF